MNATAASERRGILSLLVVSVVVVLVSFGFARGWWLPNVHNGLLALAFALVGAYVMAQRPGHLEGWLFLSVGALEAVMFVGRQVDQTSSDSGWWGWVGVTPVAGAIALSSVAVICFPDGRLPSRSWRWIVVAVVVVAAALTTISGLYPVAYDSAGVRGVHPVNEEVPHQVATVWRAIAHTAYPLFQALWVVAIVARWRRATAPVRRQLRWLLLAASISVAALLVGLAGWGSPRAGILTAALVPVAAGLAIVHGQHATAYAALTWLSRSGTRTDDLPTHFARTVAEAMAAPAATLWIAVDGERLHAVGVFPESGQDIEPVTLAELQGADLHVRSVPGVEATDRRDLGAISVDRPAGERLSLAESRLLDDLASQARLVIEHINLAEVVTRQRTAGFVASLTPRENDVLALMAQGLSNAAMSEQLHLSIKTIEPIVSTIFLKLGLHADAASNRRVLAVLAFLRS